ncbi:MAG: hypothetical protein OXU20_32425 [Myxococcales bacterium]|nr:hypothetical protein [Myxococcales bacterium]
MLEHQRSHGVAEEMAAARLAQLGALDVVAHQLGQPRGREALAHRVVYRNIEWLS